ncbi:MAG: hypothetical protein HY815_12830, partial [Candidatus Riflebacteria bacterium]|nr:hypothetical protein [Candidatus Riflebacteria bacterium]
PVLNIVAKYDHVAPAESCQALSDHVKVPGSKLEVLEAGHLGPALGRDMKFQRTDAYWNVVVDWLERFGPGQR